MLTNNNFSHRPRLFFLVFTCLVIPNENKVNTFPYPYAEYYNNLWHEDELTGNITLFVEQFTSEMKRDVITTQLLACPYTPLCNFTFGLDVPPGYELTCEPCRCDHDCLDTKACCPDVVPDWMYDEAIGHSEEMGTGEDNGEMCLLYFGNVHTICSSNEAVQPSNCTHGYTNEDLYGNVLPLSHMSDIMDVVPVTNKKDGRTFLNRNCALCNTDDLEFWDTYIRCQYRFERNNLYSLRKLLLGLQRPFCTLEFRNPNFTVSACSPVSTCFDKDSEEKIQIGCSLYESIIHIDGLTFKNIQCAACNGNSLAIGSLRSVNENEGVSLFEGKLNYATFKDDVDNVSNVTFDLDYEPTYNEEKCFIQQMYDAFTNNCVYAGCPAMTIWFERECKRLFTEVDGISYKSVLTFTINSTMVLEKSEELHHVYDSLVEAIYKYEAYLENKFGYNITFIIGNIDSHNRHEIMASSYPLTVTDVSIELYFYFDAPHPISYPIDVAANMDHLSQLECTIHLNESVARHSQEFTLSVKILKEYRMSEIGNESITHREPDGITEWLDDLNMPPVRVFGLLTTCVLVTVCKDTFVLNGTSIQWNETWDGLLFPTYGQRVRIPEFSYRWFPYSEERWCIHICNDTLYRVITSTPPEMVHGIANKANGWCFHLRVLLLCLTLLWILKYCPRTGNHLMHRS